MKKKVLFVCLGNICRSPSAEAVFKGLVNKAGLSNRFEIDSAGTIAVHSGEMADSRMRKHAQRRGYSLESISRKVKPFIDFDYFDYIIAMDDQNYSDLVGMALSDKHIDKISKMTDYSKKFNYSEVPDPYYGGDQGFELVLDLLEDACEGLLTSIHNDF
ncbi:MAG: low molecular weight phosphotyrosine protein phosphatase [Prolixibacteraceae bacterium]|jgi:protein-tyrosine phosphatase|nr:low molecular weight phosphotyrosine protein phosphatase [Prolixibacteraceae bacterium]